MIKSAKTGKIKITKVNKTVNPVFREYKAYNKPKLLWRLFMHSAIILLITSISFLIAIIIASICFYQTHTWIRFAWLMFSTTISFILILSIFSAICRLHCLFNTTITETSEEYEIIDIEKIEYKYRISYIDNNTVKAITTSDVYDILEITDRVNNMNEKTLSVENNFMIRINQGCNSPEIIQKIALLHINENTIRVYTNNKELLNYYKECTNEMVWYIIAIATGIYCILLTIGMVLDIKKFPTKEK